MSIYVTLVLYDLTDFLLGPLKDLWDGIKNILQKILCVLTAIADYFLKAIVVSINTVIVGLGDFIGYLFGLLPNMPDTPDWGETPDLVFHTANWIFPIGFLIEMIGVLITLWLVWQAIAIGLRWAKAIPN